MKTEAILSILNPVKRYVPSHCSWALNGNEYSNPAKDRSGAFEYSLAPPIEKKRGYSFSNEIQRACESLDARRLGRPLALAFTGGLDSQLIAVNLLRLGIPFELFFLNIWGLNQSDYQNRALPFAKKHNLKLHEIHLDRDFFYEEHSLKQFRLFGVEQPTYLAMSYLFSQVPKDHFIVVGDGDFQRSGPLFQAIAARESATMHAFQLPFSCTSVYYYLWAHRNSRMGEYYFFSSTPELISATLNHPAYEYRYPFAETRGIIHHEFPKLPQIEKSTNWDTHLANKENRWIRNWLRTSVIEDGELEGWQPARGCVVDLSCYLDSNVS